MTTIIQWLAGEAVVAFLLNRFLAPIVGLVPEADRYVAVSWTAVAFVICTIIWSVTFTVLTDMNSNKR